MRDQDGCGTARAPKRKPRFPLDGHHAKSTPSSRDVGQHRRPSTRREGGSRDLLPRFQIVGSAHSKTSVCPCRPQLSHKTTIMENHLSDPSTSPAHYTRSLFIQFPCAVTPADAEEGGWIPTFSHVVSLAISIEATNASVPLSLFHGFSPVIRSLRLASTTVAPSLTLDFICSFPLLEDVSLIAWFVDTNRTTTDDQPTSFQLSKPPALTGSLELSFVFGMGLIPTRLMSLPSGLHFRRLDLAWSSDEDISSTAALVERCCHTIEYLNIGFGSISTWF